jgi:hypothetical protein
LHHLEASKEFSPVSENIDMRKYSTKKQLLISYNFPPLANAESIVTAKMVKGVQDRGLQTDVCTVKPNSNPEANDESLLDLLPAGIKIHRCPSLPGGKLLRFLRIIKLRQLASIIGSFPDEKIFWLPSAVMKINRLVKESDYRLIYSTSFPMTNHLLGYIFKKKTRLPWLVNYSDPWIDSPFYSQSLNCIKNLHSYLEKKIVESADLITFPNDGLLRLVMAKYPEKLKNKCHVIPHSFTPVNSIAPQNCVVDSKYLNVIYIGTFHGKRTPIPLFEALKKYKRKMNLKPKLRIYLIGRMPHDDYSKIINEYAINDMVFIKKPLSYKKAMVYAFQANVLLTIDPVGAASDVFLSSKLIEYLGFKKPIWGILNDPGIGASFLNSLNMFVANIRKIESIMSSLEEIYNQWETGELKSRYPKSFGIGEFSLYETSSKLSTLIDSII